MELIPINESKLKIMLDESDMKELNICDEADCANNETRHAIRTILDRAKMQIGFNTEGAEIFVQLYTSKSGGCELFVTKSNISNQIDTAAENKSDRKSKKRDSHQKKSDVAEECRSLSAREQYHVGRKKAEYGKMIFSFESLSDICKVCKILQTKTQELVSSVYMGISSDFYLILENTNMAAYTHLDQLTFILEYGKRERADHINTYLCEYGKIICQGNAVDILSKF